ncbi:MAG: hypothetical protein ACLP56_10405 [Candidatus Sulfotelmatobacter sp.]
MATPIIVTVGRRKPVLLNDPEVKIKCVCKSCNNGWMSKVEEANKLAMRAMFNDDPHGLTKRDQEKLTRWAVLKAMVLDSYNARRKFFGDVKLPV